jgi:hypothetical protein
MPISVSDQRYGKRASRTLLAIAATVTSAVAVPIGSAGATAAGPIVVTPYSGYSSLVTRVPYLTDVTQTSVDVNWATTSAVAGSLEWGPLGSCTLHSATVPSSLPSLIPLSGSSASATGRAFTVGSVNEYQSTVVLNGLSPSTTYCYRVLSGGAAPVDLLGSNSSPYFTTLDPVGSTPATPLTFDVVGDLGETKQSAGVEFPNSLNSDQAAIDSLIGSSGARFVVTAGDVAYGGGTQQNYGDLQQNGSEVSDIFGPSYWPKTGGIPTFAGDGNHGQNVNGLRIWPESNTTAASQGTYAFDQYPALVADGTTAGTYPDAWYAVSTGKLRIYVLNAAWSDATGPSGNLGSATGSACGPVGSSAAVACEGYQVDHDQHWTPNSPEYQWLAADLASHPVAVKMAVWHYPLRSDNGTQPSDNYLQNTAANPYQSTSLESLLSTNGVGLVFNAHAHTYQRIAPNGPGQVVNYVTGGGGGILEPVLGGSTCTNLTKVEAIYALGWSPAAASGSSCGAPTPQSAAQVYNFLKVTVSGNTATVSPTNASGQIFDQQTYTYNMAPPPTAPTGVSATATSSAVALTWSASISSTGVITSYQISRNGAPLASVAGSVCNFTDAQVQPGGTYSYTVTAVDSGGNTSASGISNSITVPLLTTGFEIGNLSGWSPVVGGVSVQSQAVHSGAFASEVTSTGGQSFILQNLPSSSTTMYAQGWFNIASQTTSATLFGLRTQATSTTPARQVAGVYLAANGQVKLRNNISGTNYAGTTTVQPGSWHEFTLGINESLGSLQVWVDGQPDPALSQTNQSLGTVPMSNVQIGDDSTGRTYTWFADDLTVSTSPPPPLTT